jgi:hypothetical protein
MAKKTGIGARKIAKTGDQKNDNGFVYFLLCPMFDDMIVMHRTIQCKRGNDFFY